MMEAETFFETLDYSIILTWLRARLQLAECQSKWGYLQRLFILKSKRNPLIYTVGIMQR